MTTEKVIYRVREDTTTMEKMIAWYTFFLNVKPTKVNLTDPPYYAVFKTDSGVVGGLLGRTKIWLVADPTVPQLTKPAFHWELRNSDEVKAKYEVLKARQARFASELTVISRLPAASGGARSTRQAAAEVQEFVVLDPSGNKVGVINNPIYTPKSIDLPK
ncbi:VOC family protein [Hymenobacter algoricola]|uniref:Glyoxalase/fosfomycin resistance/dioxygenase domain-containing protein n=1 Tax=Hymenobacter algoricola TaxID=486267 RepID=A0ABP7MAG2_9BACT